MGASFCRYGFECSHCAKALALMAGLAAAGSALAQTSTYTGGATGDVNNWCNGSNWQPSGVPADGNTINVPAGFLANMFNCSGGASRILGPITAAGVVRFWVPVTFMAGGSLANPVFDFGDTVNGVGGTLTVSGTDSQWHGGIFSGGEMSNTGTMTVQHIVFGARAMPRELRDGFTLTNSGTMRLIDGFAVEGTAAFFNSGTVDCNGNVGISRTSGFALTRNTGTINVTAGNSLSISTALDSTNAMTSAGTLTIQSESTITGTALANAGGTIRVAGAATTPMHIGPLVISGEGNFQLSNGLTQLHGDITCGIRGVNGAHGLWFTSSTPIDVSDARIFLGQNAQMQWGQGTIVGMDGLAEEPHIDVGSGGTFLIAGSPGFSGGGDARGLAVSAAGSMLQYSNIRLFEESTVNVPSGGRYLLSHARLDGDGTGLVSVEGQFDVNAAGDARPNAAFISGVELDVTASGVVNVFANDFITGNTGSPAAVFLDGSARTTIYSGAKWRAFGDNVAGPGTIYIGGSGTFDLPSGGFLTVSAAPLTMDMGLAFGSSGTFDQSGSIRTPAGAEGQQARLHNDGNWYWRGGGITFPQGSEPAIINNGNFTADCGLCQFRGDMLNTHNATIVDTLVFAEQGSEFRNHGFMTLIGNVSDATSSEGKLINELILQKTGPNSSSINSRFSNEGTTWVSQSTLFINGAIDQFFGGELSGGRWEVSPGATLNFGNRAVTQINAGASVLLEGAWTNFHPQRNYGTLEMRGVQTGVLPTGFMNYGTLNGSTTTGSIVNHSWLRPGFSPGIFTVQGNYQQTAPWGWLEVELGGYAAGTEYDKLVVSGTATLGGTLSVHLINDFVPQIGDEFTVLTASSIAGAFASLDVVAPGLPTGHRLSARNTGTAIVVSVTCISDFNGDVVVDFFDYLDFVQAFSTSAPESDVNYDGVVDFFDYLDFVQAFSGGC